MSVKIDHLFVIDLLPYKNQIIDNHRRYSKIYDLVYNKYVSLSRILDSNRELNVADI